MKPSHIISKQLIASMTDHNQLLEQTINSNDVNKLRRLVNDGNVDLNATDEQGSSLLHKAIQQGHP